MNTDAHQQLEAAHGATNAAEEDTLLEDGGESLLIRLHRAFGPLAGAILLDILDFATFGPIGIVLGFVLGCPIGWWLSGIYEFSTQGRIVFAILAGLYCMAPFTELIPLATIIAAIARFRPRLPPQRNAGTDGQSPSEQNTVDAKSVRASA